MGTLLRVMRAAGLAAALLLVVNGAVAPPSQAKPPRGGLIAFVSDRTGTPQLFTVDANGGPVRQLTNDASGVAAPAWSSDGRRLLVRTGCLPSCSGFATMRPDGSDRVELTGTAPAFSPNGKWLSYSVCTGVACDLYVAHAHGRHPVLVDSGTGFPLEGQPWSGDSKTLLYQKDAVLSFSDLWLADRNGTGRKLLLADVSNLSTPVFFPDDGTVAFVADFPARLNSLPVGAAQPSLAGTIGDSGSILPSPDRTRLAVQGFAQGPGGFLSIRDAALATEWVAPGTSAGGARWSPDSTRVAYGLCDSLNYPQPPGPCSIRVGGTADAVLYQGPAQNTYEWSAGLDWSPDSTMLVLSVAGPGEPLRLVTVGADGSGLAPFPVGGGNNAHPAWQPGS